MHKRSVAQTGEAQFLSESLYLGPDRSRGFILDLGYSIHRSGMKGRSTRSANLRIKMQLSLNFSHSAVCAAPPGRKQSTRASNRCVPAVRSELMIWGSSPSRSPVSELSAYRRHACRESWSFMTNSNYLPMITRVFLCMHADRRVSQCPLRWGPPCQTLLLSDLLSPSICATSPTLGP